MAFPMDPAIQPNRLYLWQDVDAAMDGSGDSSLFQLKEERLLARTLFQNQSEDTRRFFQRQAVSIAEALLEFKSGLNFALPEFISLPNDSTDDYRPVEVPVDFRRQSITGLLGRLPLKDVRSVFRQRLSRLEESMYPAVAAGAGLLRYAVARHIVQDRITVEVEAVVENAGVSLAAVERKLGEYRRSVDTLYQALSLAPYIYTDEEYQSKRAGILSRLIPLGHRLSHLHVRRIIETIDRRAKADDLNRGLSLSLPYFDDRALEMKLYEFEVIPPGRTMFVPAFVALAAVREQEKIEQNNALSPSTRVHLLEEIKSLQWAFGPGAA
jgi:hypothetical protein